MIALDGAEDLDVASAVVARCYLCPWSTWGIATQVLLVLDTHLVHVHGDGEEVTEA